jgi:hypothetical protein
MPIRGAVFTCILLLSLCSGRASAEEGIDHQIFTVSVSQVVRAAKLAFADLDRGVLGADPKAGIVISTTKPLSAIDVKELVVFDEPVEITSLFVVMVTPRGPDSSEVEVMTVIRGRSTEKGFLGGGVYLSASPLSDAVYSALETYLGKGHVHVPEK